MRVNLDEAITKLQNGEVVAIPTETVYGLAADASNDAALRQIYTIKQRPTDNPLIVHIADASQVYDWASEFSPLAQKLASAFWPGPFTLVLPAKPHVSNILRGNNPTVALRVPNHALTLQLLKQSGLALAAPSANKFTQLSPTTAAHVATSLGDAVAVLDGGACEVGIESTIVAVDGENWQLLRLGMLSETNIQTVAGVPATKSALAIKAPGQHVLHYSPRTPIQLFSSRADLIAHASAFSNIHAAALLLGPGALPNCTYFELNYNATDVAQKLYDTLYQLDALHAEKLLIEAPPNATEWLAILDRLTRAAHC
ncbi:MAG TPA: L-threonylcarbamoyladenylate synthase [Methylotenera sp.]|nr:L-threonylcarbamoyladenylate synthase [Methylotenera sp.]